MGIPVCQLWQLKGGRRLKLWVDDSFLHSFEACTETVDDGVAAFFLKATHVHAGDVDPSVCDSVVVLFVSHVDDTEMACRRESARPRTFRRSSHADAPVNLVVVWHML